MHSGLLWFDGSKKPIEQKIEDAARRYREKFGQPPNTAFIHPSDFLEFQKNIKKGKNQRFELPEEVDVSTLPSIEITPQMKKDSSLQVKPKSTIMQNHVWLGLAD